MLIKEVNGKIPQIPNDCYVAENATIIGDVIFGDNCSVWFNAIIRGDVNFIKIGNKVNIQDGAVIHCTYKKHPTIIGNNVSIGKNCLIHPNVSIYDNSIIGDNVVIHSNTVLGADAFYYKKKAEGFDQLISVGRVVLKDNVHIGASCTIDKGVTGDTTVGIGTKIDNQVHIGHDSIIGKNCLIASQTGIAGCVIIEDDVTLWGQVGTNSGISIGKGAVILGQTGVTKSVPGGKTYFGTPITESRAKLKEIAYLKRLMREEKKG